jgi:hypothetical protein
VMYVDVRTMHLVQFIIQINQSRGPGNKLYRIGVVILNTYFRIYVILVNTLRTGDEFSHLWRFFFITLKDR